jgi:hypothetical protein
MNPPRTPGEDYVVICRDDAGFYTLASRRYWHVWEHALAYSKTIAPTREPIVVSGRWHELRNADLRQE